MNRVTRRIIANKDFSKYRAKANNAFVVFQNDTKELSGQFAQLLDTFEDNDPKNALALLNNMILKMNVMSTNLTTLKNIVTQELNQV